MTEITVTTLVAIVFILLTLMVSVAFLRIKSSRVQDGIAPVLKTSMVVSSDSWKYDVFLSFRGIDTRKTFVDHLYSALVERLIHTYKDDETLSRGDTISTSLLNAIDESQIALIIFSKNYADSSWCLDELEYIMKCRNDRGKIVIPIFYDVDPSEVRKQKGEFGKAFAKQRQKTVTTKFESWKKALVDSSNIAGWEPKHIAGGHEAKCIKDIVGTVLDKLLALNSVVDEKLIGMGTRMQDLKSQLEIGSGGVRMVGIWGIGGGGKTTLASSIYIEISCKFDSCCFVGNIKDESSKLGMETLQEKFLSTLLKTEVKVPSVDIGKHMIKSRLGRRNVLIVLDDVDDRKQLEALAGSHNWFGEGSRIIITTRNEQLLRTHRVDEVSSINLLSHEEAIRLFNRHAYNENKLIEDYYMLSLRVVTYAAGLPLALIVLGSFLYDKDKHEWISTLDRLKDIPEMEIVEKLKISYDGLKPLEKELFLDIACFFRRKSKDDVVVMLNACGFHPVIGVKVLIQKGLITISSEVIDFREQDVFDMHDLVQEMGHYIVRGEYLNNPEKHSRLWRQEEVEDICTRNTTNENDKTEAIVCYRCPSSFGKLFSNLKLRLLSIHNVDEVDIEGPSNISNELRYMFWERYPASPFPESFQPGKLVILKLTNSLQEDIWKGYKSLPCLKELELYCGRALLRTPDFDGLPCLQKLTLYDCISLEEIHPSLENHTCLVYMNVAGCKKLRRFPNIVKMGKLEVLEISDCDVLRKFPYIEANMDGLPHLPSEHVGIEELNLITTRPPSIPQLPRFLKRLILMSSGLKDGEIPCDIAELSNLQELYLSGNKFSRFNFSLLKLTRLKILDLDRCMELVELPKLPSNIATLKAEECRSLTFIGDIYANCKWLCEISLLKGNILTDVHELLQSMLQGNAVENHFMILQLEGVEIPKGFVPHLLKGKKCRVQLPENWYNDYSGFLMCAVVKDNSNILQYITMTHENDSHQGIDDSHYAVIWEESVDDKSTWVGYVSFGLLRHTTWWDQTSGEVLFSIDKYESYSGFGVCLVSKTRESCQRETTTEYSSDFSDGFRCEFSITHDSKSDLKCLFSN